MNKIPAIAVDNQQSSLRTIQIFAEKYPRVDLIHSFTDPFEAIAYVSSQTAPHIIFSDINMPEFSGIDLAKTLLGSQHQIIFTTSYPSHALEGYDLRIRNFLVKPFSLTEFVQKTDVVIREFFPTSAIEKTTDDSFFLRDDEDPTKLVRVLKADIVMIKADRNNILIHTTSRIHSIYLTFKEITTILAETPNFYRIERSQILNSSHVKTIVGNTIMLSNNYKAVMTPTYNEKFVDWVQRIWLKTNRK